MSTDNNRLALEVTGSPQAADNKQTIGAKAVAYIEQNGVTTYPDPVEVVFELPKGSGAVFTDTLTETTSRLTLKASGRTDPTVPVQFKSEKAIDGGMLKAYWKIDPDNTLQQKPFTFTQVSSGNNIYLQMLDKTYASVGDAGDWMGDGTLIVCSKTSPDPTCQFVIEPNGDQTVSFRLNDGSGRYWAVESQEVGTVPNAIIASSQKREVFDISYQNGGASMTILWAKKLYLSLTTGGLPEAGLITATKWQPDAFCYFTVTHWGD